MPGSMAFERDNIARMHGYTPGEQPQTGDVVKLNTNENPYPPAQAVLDAVHGVTGEMLRRYPPPRASGFRDTAARVHDLKPENVIATNGGDELLRLAVTVFCQSKAGQPQGPGGMGETDPTYSLYDTLAEVHNTPITRIDLRDDWSLPDNFAAKLNEAGCRLALVVNPHAPSGRLEPLDTLRSVAGRFRGVLLIDEAYVDFAERDALDLVRGDEAMKNVLILRTLSKGYSLAGLRFGYGLGHAELIAALDKARDSYNTDVIAQRSAVAALESRDHALKNCRAVIDERRRLAEALAQRGYTVYPSQSNFLLAAVAASGASAATIYQSLKAGGVFVRYFDHTRLRDKLRITVGSPEQNDALLAALDAL